MSKLILTDFGRLTDATVNKNELWGELKPISADSAYARLTSNMKKLTEHGARGESVGGKLVLPINRISGFPIGGDDRLKFPNLKGPGEVEGDASKSLKLLIWGAPHPNASSSNSDIHGSMVTAADYKTQAFESMAWLCSTGTVIMTFPQKYLVEFYQPLQVNAAKRFLLCGKMFSRHYVPMASGNGMRFNVPEADAEDIVIALLLQPEYMDRVVRHGDEIDFGKTVLGILGSLSDKEYAVALGVYDASLEMELVYALEDVKT